MYYTGAGLASLVFAAVNLLPYGWRALYVIGAVPLFLVAYLRRRLPETKRFAAQEDVHRHARNWRTALSLLRDLVRQYPGRIATILIAVAAFGFAISLGHRAVGQISADASITTRPARSRLLFIPGGLIGLALAILAGRLSDRIGRKPVAFAIVAFARHRLRAVL